MRIKLNAFNTTDDDIPLNFSNMGSLTTPIKCSRLQVISFSIPNASTPLMTFTPNTYQFTLAWKGTTFSSYVTLEDRGHGNDIYELSHLVSMINTCLQTCIIGLNALRPLPTLVAPYVYYTPTTGLYSFVADVNYYNDTLPDPIYVYCNAPVYYIFRSMPFYYNSSGPSSLLYRFIFKVTNETTYLTNYVRVTQESISLASYVSPRTILIATSMPVEGVVFTSSSQSSNQSILNVIQDYIIPYNNGTLDLMTNSDFTMPNDPYRVCKLTNGFINEAKCDAYYQTRDGVIHQFFLPPHSVANIEIEFA